MPGQLGKAMQRHLAAAAALAAAVTAMAAVAAVAAVAAAVPAASKSSSRLAARGMAAPLALPTEPAAAAATARVNAAAVAMAAVLSPSTAAVASSPLVMAGRSPPGVGVGRVAHLGQRIGWCMKPLSFLQSRSPLYVLNTRCRRTAQSSTCHRCARSGLSASRHTARATVIEVFSRVSLHSKNSGCVWGQLGMQAMPAQSSTCHRCTWPGATIA